MNRELIYFDNAATTFQKPPQVAVAMQTAMKTASSPGRGGYRQAEQAARIMLELRVKAAEFFHATAPDNVLLTSNATHGLNMAIRSAVPPGSTVLVSGYEHNSVMRPLAALDANIITVRAPLFSPEGFLVSIRSLMDTARPAAVVCTHVSNVFGYILPVYQVGELCRKRKIPFIVDASQSAGVLPVDMQGMNADYVAMPGHKSLYGPQGTGLLLCGETVEPLLSGGTGSDSRSYSMPAYLPDRGEAGTANVPGAAGLLAGLRFVAATGTERILRHERWLAQKLTQRLETVPGAAVYRPQAEDSTGVVSFSLEGRDAEWTAQALALENICVRAGLHCAIAAHMTAGTAEHGTVRVSFSAFNNEKQVDRFSAVLRNIAAR